MRARDTLTQAIYLLLRWHQKDDLAEIYQRKLSTIEKELTTKELTILAEIATDLDAEPWCSN